MSIKLSLIDLARKMGEADAARDKALADIQGSITATIKASLAKGADALKATRDVFKTGYREGVLKRMPAAYRASIKHSAKDVRNMPDGEDKARILRDRGHLGSLTDTAWFREVKLAKTGTKRSDAKGKVKSKGTKKTTPKVAPQLKSIAKVTATDVPLLEALKWATVHRDMFMAWAATVMPKD